jgi:D-aminopeptidase
MSRLREAHGLVIGEGSPGPTNSIVDVPGVLVGHCTVRAPSGACTGVTAVLPHSGDLYREKVPAAATVINGYGKLTGLPQIGELGTLETPIVLTNTLSVGTAWDAVVTWTLQRFDRADDPIHSINPVIGECNDGRVNDIRARAVAEQHVLDALDGASSTAPEEGCVGAGAGMTAFGWKSGVGSSSRRVVLDEGEGTVGVIALPNLGRSDQLSIKGVPIGDRLPGPFRADPAVAGSIVVVIGTDLPCSPRQLGRLARRAAVGIARVGATCDGTSGEFAMAFTTASPIPQGDRSMLHERRINDVSRGLDDAFAAVIEATEEAILSALFSAKPTVTHSGLECPSLPEDAVLGLLRGDSKATA